MSSYTLLAFQKLFKSRFLLQLGVKIGVDSGVREMLENGFSARSIVTLDETPQKCLELFLAPLEFLVFEPCFHSAGGQDRTADLGFMSPTL